MLLRLIPKSKLAKRRIRELGDIWEVLGNGHDIACLGGVEGFLINAQSDITHQHSRWICVKNDIDFDYEVLTGEKK